MPQVTARAWVPIGPAEAFRRVTDHRRTAAELGPLHQGAALHGRRDHGGQGRPHPDSGAARPDDDQPLRVLPSAHRRCPGPSRDPGVHRDDEGARARPRSGLRSRRSPG